MRLMTLSFLLLSLIPAGAAANQATPFAVITTRGTALWSPDPQVGFTFYMQKPEPTSVMTGPTARVVGVEGIRLTSLGFDYRLDGHCGAGAPRFNITTEDGLIHFFGCHYGNHSVVEGYPNWRRVRFTPADSYPPGGFDLPVIKIGIEFDEGPDQGPGFATMTNFYINDVVINRPSQ